MSEIRKGDLVMVTRPCCAAGPKGSNGLMGHPFTALEISESGSVYCNECGATVKGKQVRDRPARNGGEWWPIHMLTKIDPPPIAEPVKREEGVPA